MWGKETESTLSYLFYDRIFKQITVWIKLLMKNQTFLGVQFTKLLSIKNNIYVYTDISSFIATGVEEISRGKHIESPWQNTSPLCRLILAISTVGLRSTLNHIYLTIFKDNTFWQHYKQKGCKYLLYSATVSAYKRPEIRAHILWSLTTEKEKGFVETNFSQILTSNWTR